MAGSNTNPQSTRISSSIFDDGPNCARGLSPNKFAMFRINPSLFPKLEYTLFLAKAPNELALIKNLYLTMGYIEWLGGTGVWEIRIGQRRHVVFTARIYNPILYKELQTRP